MFIMEWHGPDRPAPPTCIILTRHPIYYIIYTPQGFYYIGPVDGHDLDNLIPILENLRDSPSTKPVLLHVKVRRFIFIVCVCVSTLTRERERNDLSTSPPDAQH